MHIGAVDESAVLGRSWLHAAAPRAKLFALAIVLAAVMASWNIVIIGSVSLVLIATLASTDIKLRLALGLAAYPAVFALVFAASSAPNALTGATIVLKAVTAALAAVTVVLSTPYPRIFAPIQRVTPSVVGDALLMTYRSTFLLLEKFSNLTRAVRLRSGLGTNHPLRTLRTSTQALGGLLLYSFDLSQRDYDIMRLRGYQGRLATGSHGERLGLSDAIMLGVTLVLLGISVLWRVRADALNPYSWIVAPVPLAALAVTLIIRWRRR